MTRWPYAVLGGGYGLLGVALILYGLRRRAEVDEAIRAGAYAAPGDRALALIGAAAVVLALATGVVIVDRQLTKFAVSSCRRAYPPRRRWRGMYSPPIHQFARYAAVGVLNTVVTLAAYHALLVAGTHFRLASAVGYTLGGLTSYAANRAWTFAGQHGSHRRAGPRFLVVFVLGLVTDSS